MKSSTTTKFVIIAILILLALYQLYPTYEISAMSEDEKQQMELQDQKAFFDLKSESINLGLDLQGGMHVVLEVDVKELLNELAKNKTEAFNQTLEQTEIEVSETDADFISTFNNNLKEKGLNIARFFSSVDRRTEDDVLEYLREQTEDAVTRSLEIMRNRVDEFGVSEPIIQKQGDRRIIVELAGVSNPGRVRNLIGRTALLEFQLLKDNMVSQTVAEKINNYIQGKLEDTPDTTAAETKEETDTTTTALEEMFGLEAEDTATTALQDTTGFAEMDSTERLIEENMFLLDPNDKQTLLVPVDKEAKFKRLIELAPIRKIIQEEAGNAEFLWGSKPVYNDEYYKVYLVNKNVELTGATIADAYPQTGSKNDPNAIGKFEVGLNLNDEGARTFSRVSGANIGKRLAIVLDNKVFLAPTLQNKITGGRARITGLESMNEARDLAIVLKAGALPAPVEIIEERTVGPSLGRDSINAGSLSATIGLVIVMIFMVLYYRMSGLVADLALVLNIIFIMAVMAYFHATLTLPGIAGIILTIGMAVDANVLIFERIREELDRGKTIRSALEIGYGKAFITILDANVTTFIAGLVLYSFGSGPIQGFALTLMIGIAASMFTAIVVTRTIFDFTLEKRAVKKLSI
ncbi:MAG: protein translocase subunit SecD [Caldithrix sp.]|nr:protein translocase subunit SecD [Caldithrix sp.]